MYERKVIIKKVLIEAAESTEGSDFFDSDANPPATLESYGQICRACHELAERYDLYPAMKAMMMHKWGAESMEEIPLPALPKLLYYMRDLGRLIQRL